MTPMPKITPAQHPDFPVVMARTYRWLRAGPLPIAFRSQDVVFNEKARLDSNGFHALVGRGWLERVGVLIQGGYGRARLGPEGRAFAELATRLVALCVKPDAACCIKRSAASRGCVVVQLDNGFRATFEFSRDWLHVLRQAALLTSDTPGRTGLGCLGMDLALGAENAEDRP